MYVSDYSHTKEVLGRSSETSCRVPQTSQLAVPQKQPVIPDGEEKGAIGSSLAIVHGHPSQQSAAADGSTRLEPTALHMARHAQCAARSTILSLSARLVDAKAMGSEKDGLQAPSVATSPSLGSGSALE